MKKIQAIFYFLFFVQIAHAQNFPYCKAGLFSEQTYYANISLTHDTDVVYGNNLDYLGNMQALKMDIHYPNLAIDPLPLRPLIIMIHGGTFNWGSKSDLNAYCIKLARAGYVAASVEYRMGWSNVGNCAGNMSQLSYAMYRATQDVKASMRYLVANANNYRIDTSYIFLAGQSEGGMTALNCGFMNQQEANNLMPGAFADLGYLDSASNNYLQGASIKGIFNWCGAILDTSIIHTDTQIPVLSIHGLLDSIVPVEYGKYFNCQNANNPYPNLYGPKSIYQRMKNLSICSEANFDANGAHCVFPSLDPDIYIPAKFTCFFKNLLCGNCTTESKVSYNQKSCMESAPTGLDEFAELVGVEIFPNPNQGNFTIALAMGQKSEVKVELINSIGIQVGSLLQTSLVAGEHQLNFEYPSSFAKGLYLVKITLGKQVVYKKCLFN